MQVLRSASLWPWRALAPFPTCVVPDSLSSPRFLLSVELSPIVTLAKGEHGAGRQLEFLSLSLFKIVLFCLSCLFIWMF